MLKRRQDELRIKQEENLSMKVDELTQQIHEKD